jgi:DNA protecting protein DprA
MPINAHDLVDRFGRAVDEHVASILVGAGLSVQAGLPDWGTLIRPLADKIGLTHVSDMPLAAEYFEQNASGGRGELQQHLKDGLSRVVSPHEGQVLVTQLGVNEIWTTNFDPLLEAACPDAAVITTDDEAGLYGTGGVVIVKMHGGFTVTGSSTKWRASPVITRGDFERYDVEHPRLWALLQATYLTRNMLFLGFSFTDPNIELLLRLARRQGTASGNQHLAVLRRPSNADEIAEHNLRVHDLETNGVDVCEIGDFADLVPLLLSIKRRTRVERLFISGSGDDAIKPWCDATGVVVARHPTWQVASLGGDAGWWTTRRVGIQRQSLGTYDPEVLRLYFRHKTGEPPPPILTERIGTAVFSPHDRHPLVDGVIEGCRAMVIIGGGTRTLEEVDIALERGLGVVPIAASGGAARAAWEAALAPDADPRRLLLGGHAASKEMWQKLADADELVVQQAAGLLLEQAMYSSRPRIVGAARYRGFMDDSYTAAVSLAALEVLPAEPSDLGRILQDDELRTALLSFSGDGSSSELVAWLCEEVGFARVETWQKHLERIARDLGARPVMIHHVDYPRPLRRCWDAPPLLFVRGSLNSEPAVAIVGSRSASAAVREAAYAVASIAARAGMSVVSGLACGVDTAAHEGALAAGGHTVAVMGTGIERVFPEENAGLASRIVDHGALVSQFAPNAPRTGTTFLRRNAVIAGLSQVDVVMAGTERSGSRHQAEQAMRYHLPLLLWRPALQTQRWALEAVDAGTANFIDDPADIVDYGMRKPSQDRR